MPIPNKVRLADEEFAVIQKSLTGKLGYFDRSNGEIAIEVNQPEAGKHVILLHELLHFTAELLIQNGVLKRQPPEAFIEHAAPVLLSLLVNSGIWSGLTAEEFEVFAEAQMALPAAV